MYIDIFLSSFIRRWCFFAVPLRDEVGEENDDDDEGEEEEEKQRSTIIICG